MDNIPTQFRSWTRRGTSMAPPNTAALPATEPCSSSIPPETKRCCTASRTQPMGDIPLRSSNHGHGGEPVRHHGRGGASSNCPGRCGTVFKLDTSGNETVLHSFTGSPDGASPYGALVMDTAGNLYGTTTQGG